MNRTEPYRPQWHFSPAKNWMNDPNGLIWLDGEYHLFYQFNPFGDQWGHMSWGHAVSRDLVHWQELAVAIPEDERVSIYSGSVVLDQSNSSGFGVHGRAPLVAVYTGCLRRPEGGQAQELAYSNDRGRTWTKFAGNPVLDLGMRDFRDPKVFWHAPTSRWIMVVVLPDDRRAQFYGSHNLRAWTLLSEFEAPFEGQGIWECPDLIELPGVDGESIWMLKVDALLGHPSGGSGARIFFGQFDGVRFVAEPEESPRWADLGADFYAALSWANLPDAKLRPVWLAWMNCHRYAKLLPTHPWRGSMSAPRELRARRAPNGWQLLQQPVREWQVLRGPRWQCDAGAVNDGESTIKTFDAACRTPEIEFSVGASHARESGLLLRWGASEHVRIGFDHERSAVYVDRAQAGFNPPGDALYVRRRWASHLQDASKALRFRVLVDCSSVEVFVGDGETVLTEQILPSGEGPSLSLYAEGGQTQFGTVAVWPLATARFTS